MGDEQHSFEQTRDQAAVLLAQARAQSQDIQRALGAASGDSALKTRLSGSVAQLAAVESRLSLALGSSAFTLSGTDLLALGEIVHSGEVGALVSEATAQAGAGGSIAAAQLSAASVETRRETQSLAHDVFDRKIFEPYLHFTSPEDEAGFRKRQTEAQAYVKEQLALGTPKGDLNAGGGMIGSMLDAHAHGAGDSPEFLPRWNALVDKTQRQHAAMRAAGQSTEEYDRTLDANVRRFLQAKGLDEAEIGRRLEGGGDPLAAVKPFLANDRASRDLARDTARSAPVAVPSTPVEASAGATIAEPPPVMDFGAMNAKLKAAGVLVSDAGETVGHGLNVQKPSTPGQAIAG